MGLIDREYMKHNEDRDGYESQRERNSNSFSENPLDDPPSFVDYSTEYSPIPDAAKTVYDGTTPSFEEDSLHHIAAACKQIRKYKAPKESTVMGVLSVIGVILVLFLFYKMVS